MPQYAVLLYSPTPGDPADVPEEEIAAHMAYGDRIGELGGTIVAAAALDASTEAVSVKGTVVTDGPFAETKEVLAGFFVLEARDRDHALEIARLCPSTWRGGVEVRPILGE
ncbi:MULTISPECIES: YciI family protein [Actinokineospora]|uniref:Transcription initiation protein n=1 Tax=Actinokineospora fastidiosa TaxID=1816 RepID=A0A918GI82_9PSEU|nr:MULTISPECIES: YciI family protein [Actinokineospora]UVS80713.1 YCII-related domain protein [Actinokineospora sp. UTMC 2448]GGS36594.1 transcription initiation protein [Actinokineospora fastidiosa]